MEELVGSQSDESIEEMILEVAMPRFDEVVVVDTLEGDRTKANSPFVHCFAPLCLYVRHILGLDVGPFLNECGEHFFRSG